MTTEPLYSEAIQKLGLHEYDFPNGFAIEPTGITNKYTVSENCDFNFIDQAHIFEGDSRVKKYDEIHVITNDIDVFLEYLDLFYSIDQRSFFFNISEGTIVSIYETYIP